MTNRERNFFCAFFFSFGVGGGGGREGGLGGLVNKSLDGCGLLELHISVPIYSYVSGIIRVCYFSLFFFCEPFYPFFVKCMHVSLRSTVPVV